MNRKTFVRLLSRRLRALPAAERAESLDYYTEMIQDRMEEGLSEEQAVGQLGSVDEIARQILQDAPPAPPAQREVRGRSGWTVALIVLGSPIWLSLGLAAIAVALALAIAALAIVLSLYAVAWSLVASLYAMDLCMAAGGPAGLLGVAVGLMRGNVNQAMWFFCCGCALLGLALMLFPLLNHGTVAVARASACCARGLKRLVVGRGKA